MSKDHRLRIVLFTSAILAILFNVWFFRPPTTLSTRNGPPQVIPPEGYCFNDTHGKILGDPERTIRDGYELYRQMGVYKSRKGVLPPTDIQLSDDTYQNPSAYGFKSNMDAARWGRNPDMKNADLYKSLPEPESMRPFHIAATRPDGSRRFGAKITGNRDILAFSDIYFFRNECMFKDGHYTKKPVGFYLVLWEDGEITKVPHDQVRYVRPQRAPYGECFPGQAGTPEITYTYEEAKIHTLSMKRDGSNPNAAMSGEAKQIIAEALKGTPKKQ